MTLLEGTLPAALDINAKVPEFLSIKWGIMHRDKLTTEKTALSSSAMTLWLMMNLTCG